MKATCSCCGDGFPYFNFIPTKPEIVQIDRRGEVLGRRCRLDLGICGDVSVTAEALLNMVQEKTDSGHLDAALKRHARDVKEMNAYMEGNDKESPIRPEQLTTALNRHAASDAVFTVDTGTPVSGAPGSCAPRREGGRWLPSIMAPWPMPCRWLLGRRWNTPNGR